MIRKFLTKKLFRKSIIDRNFAALKNHAVT